MRKLSNLRPRRSIAEINIVPYIDVMLVLLIVFMVTTPLIQQGVQVELPETAQPGKAIVSEGDLPVVVTVDKHRNLYLNIAERSDEALTVQHLQAEVSAALLRNKHRLVVVKADKNVTYDTVVEAMVILQHAGVPSISLETSQATEKSVANNGTSRAKP